MTTLTELADSCQTLLSDSGASTWSQSTIEGWLNDAIRDYGNHFPRQVTATISTSLDDRTYDLPADFLEMVAVEYPTGQDPPQYLGRLPFHHPDFWASEFYYDVVVHEDTGDPAELWMSKKPAAGETITLIYLAPHDHALASGGTITVPTRHHNILVQFVFWKASQELLSAEQQNPTSNSSLLMGQLASNADRQKRAYFQALAQALRAAEGRSALVRWSGVADLDGIY